MKISVCGKGGSGKSTVVMLLADAARRLDRRVVVIDSDESNSGLFRMLGFQNPPAPLMEMVGGKSVLKKKMHQPGLLEQPEITVEDIPAEYTRVTDGLVLISIGKILQSLEGCACPMGVLSREFLKKLRLREKEMALVDMEAGVEHFGRGIDEGIDRVILVVEPAFESVNIAQKIQELAGAMNKVVQTVLNKMPSEEVSKKMEKEIQDRRLNLIGIIPHDPLIFEAGLEGRTPDQGAAARAAGEILDLLLSEN